MFERKDGFYSGAIFRQPKCYFGRWSSWEKKNIRGKVMDNGAEYCETDTDIRACIVNENVLI